MFNSQQIILLLKKIIKYRVKICNKKFGVVTAHGLLLLNQKANDYIKPIEISFKSQLGRGNPQQ